MHTHNSYKICWLTSVALAAFISTVSMAQSILPANMQTEQLNDAVAQTNGEFESVNLDYLNSLGMQQKHGMTHYHTWVKVNQNQDIQNIHGRQMLCCRFVCVKV